ncbi:DDB1- and CUL4-associated factor 6 [Actinomortierella wolfii]|nr:DDB1- and CUL4-associated factor 6 [Actinomortierella wolfii]
MSLEEGLVDQFSGGALPAPVSPSAARRRPSNFCRGLASLTASPAVRHHSLQSQLLGRPDFVRRLEQQPVLTGHHGCVNTIAWDETGEYLVSGSDDLFLNIYRPLDPQPLVHRIRSGHQHNIFSAKFLTNTQASKIVSCAADGITRLTDVHRFVVKSATDEWTPYPGYNCHTEMTYEVMPDMIDSHIFYDCADDGRIHRYDIRIRTSCDCEEREVCDRHAFINVNSNNPSARRNLFSAFSPFRLGRQRMLGVTAISQRPEHPVYIAAACSDDTVRIYDTRMVGSSNHRDAQVYSYSPFVPPGYVVGSDGELRSGANAHRSRLSTKITSLKYDPCGSGQLLVSYSRGDCYLIQPSWMGTKEEDLRRRGSLIADSSETSKAHGDKNGKRRRSSDSPEIGGDTDEPKKSTRAPSNHNTARKRSTQASTADTDTNNTNNNNNDKDKAKDKAKAKEEDTDKEKEKEKEKEEVTDKDKGKDKADGTDEGDTKMDTADSGGTSSQSNKNKQHVGGSMTRARARRLQAERAATSDMSDAPKAEGTADVEMTTDGTTDSEEKAEDSEEPRVARSESPFELRLSDVARLHGWGEAVSDNSEDGVDRDKSEQGSDDERDDENRASSDSAREDKSYWTKRSYRTGRTDTVQIYSGHRNARTMIKEAYFYGPNSEFIMSGSDDGRIFFWNKMTGKIENVIPGDRQVVNCLQPHPIYRMLLTASGIDKTIKIFMPTASKHADLSKIRGIRQPADKHGERRIVVGAKPMPFAQESVPAEDSEQDDTTEKQDSAATPTLSSPPENQLDTRYCFKALDRGSDNGSDILFSSGDEDDDDDDDDSDGGHFLSNLPARYVLQIITQLARASHRARAAQAAATEGGRQGEEDTDEDEEEDGHDNHSDGDHGSDDDESMVLG